SAARFTAARARAAGDVTVPSANRTPEPSGAGTGPGPGCATAAGREGEETGRMLPKATPPAGPAHPPAGGFRVILRGDPVRSRSDPEDRLRGCPDSVRRTSARWRSTVPQYGAAVR